MRQLQLGRGERQRSVPGGGLLQRPMGALVDGHGGLPPGPAEDQGRLLLKLQPAHALDEGADEVVLSREHRLAG
eukprot:8339213-Pyramimonas_sp.AAC.1